MHYALQKLLETIFERHIWIEVGLITETRKAILVRFDGRDAWFPKIWIVAIKRKNPVIARTPEMQKRPRTQCPRKCRELRERPISIKILHYHWAKKFE